MRHDAPKAARAGRVPRRAIVLLFSSIALIGLSPLMAPNDPAEQFRSFVFAPPTRLHIVDTRGGWHAPFIYRLRLANRLERRYEEDRSRPVRIVWWSGGRLARTDDRDVPLLLVGADGLGRDIFSRLLHGARFSLGVALLAALGSLLIGTLAGGVAGYAGGLVDDAISLLAQFVLVLPAIYVVLVLRAVLPLVLPTAAVFGLMTTILALVGWPYVTRGVRSIVATESAREYAEAAVAIGAGPARVVARHLLPAVSGFLTVQALMLVPAFILAEATLSYVGLGFSAPTPSWGSMLSEAANIRAIADFPWMLSPALAIVVTIFIIQVQFREGHVLPLHPDAEAGSRGRGREKLRMDDRI